MTAPAPNCPRCRGPFVIRTSDLTPHERVRLNCAPYACKGCGHTFGRDGETGFASQLSIFDRAQAAR